MNARTTSNATTTITTITNNNNNNSNPTAMFTSDTSARSPIRLAAYAVAAGALCFCLLAVLAFLLKRKRRNGNIQPNDSKESSSVIVLPRASMQPMTTDSANPEPEQYGELEMIPPKKHARRDQDTNGTENPRHLTRRKSSSRRRKNKAGYDEAPTLLDITTGTLNSEAAKSQYGPPPVTGSAGLPSSTHSLSVGGTTGELMKPIAAVMENETEEEELDDDDEA